MGNLFCSECCKSSDYENLNEEGNFHVDPGVNLASRIASEVDPKASIFEGSFLDQKVRFTNYSFIDTVMPFLTSFFFLFSLLFFFFIIKFTSKTTYEPRFVWVNLDTLTIHMSQHNTKERRHKEASLADVTNVERGAPKRIKSTDVVNDATCMTVNFQRGGGIDLKFSSEAECATWFAVLTKVVNYLKQKQ